MYINGIQSNNNSTNFQSSLFRTKDIRRAFINGDSIKSMYNQEREAIDRIAKDVKLEILPGVEEHQGKTHEVLKVVATDENLFPPSYSVNLYPYLLQSGGLTRAAQNAVDKLNSSAVLR